MAKKRENLRTRTKHVTLHVRIGRMDARDRPNIISVQRYVQYICNNQIDDIFNTYRYEFYTMIQSNICKEEIDIIF